MRSSAVFVAVLAVVAAASVPCVSAATPPTTPDAVKVLQELFKLLNVSADASSCVTEVHNAGADLRNFASDLTSAPGKAVFELAAALSAMSSGVNACNVRGVETKLDTLVANLFNATISGTDHDVKVIVGAADVWTALTGLASAVESGDASSIGSAIGNLLTRWTAVSGGCPSSSKACQLVDGLLRVFQVVASDVAPCEAALSPALTNLTAAVSSFESKSYSTAVADLASALDSVARATASDSCGLSRLAVVLEAVAPKLAAAIVKVENSGAVSIIVGSSKLYDAVYQAVEDVKAGDFAGVGMELGKLLQLLRASGCSTDACVVLQALLGSAQLVVTDFESCGKDADNAWRDMEDAMSDFKDASWVHGVKYMGDSLSTLASTVSDCGVSQLATVLENAATKLGDKTVANAIGKIEQVLVDGADVSNDIGKVMSDFGASQWSSLGTDLVQLGTLLNKADCTTVVCDVVEGLLDIVGTGMADLQACESDLQGAEQAFITFGQDVAGGKWKDALGQLSTALSTSAQAVSGCGLTKELGYLEQEAGVLGLGNVSSLAGDAVSIVLHGVEYADDLSQAFSAFQSHDPRAMGQLLGKITSSLLSWTEGHACTSDACYVMVGVLTFLNDIKGSIKACENDVEATWGNFSAAVSSFGDSHHSIIFHWSEDKAAITAGVADLGNAFTDVAKAVSDCHLQAFAEVLAKLAAKLGLTPEISWIEAVIKIVVDGVDIAKEVGAACTDWTQKNYAGFGFELASLIKTLL